MMRVFHGDPEKLAAPDPTLSLELLEFVAGRFGLDTNAPQDLGGSFNLNVLVDNYVVRVYGSWVSAERVQELQRIRQTLRQEGIPIPALQPACDGSLWLAFGDCILEVEQFIPGERMGLEDQLGAGMQMLGRLHALMVTHTIDVPPPIANYLPQELALDATFQATAFIRAWGPIPDEVRLVESAEKLARLLPIIELPCQLVHGDFWDNNVLFDDVGVTAVLDFDFAGSRPRVDDIALPLSYAVEHGVPLTKLRELVDAYDSGCAFPLSNEERRVLPFAMARMALFFLQYLLLPPIDAAHALRLRREFNEKRGPMCEWWLRKIQEGTVSEDMFS